MTEEEQALNRQIAEILEPYDTLPPIRRDRDASGKEIPGTEKIGIRLDGSYYPFPRHWFMSSTGWSPHDFLHDETANAMLRDKLLENGELRISNTHGLVRITRWASMLGTGGTYLAAICAAFLAMHKKEKA